MTSTTISNVRVLDGERILEDQTVTLDGTDIVSLRPSTSRDALRLALRVGVTTELAMGGVLTAPARADIELDDDLADVRSSGFGLTPPGGHPFEIIPEGAFPGEGDPGFDEIVMPLSTTPEQAKSFIPELTASGSDYIKLLIASAGVAEGLRADVLLLGGDPTSMISDTLNFAAIWRRGALVRG